MFVIQGQEPSVNITRGRGKAKPTNSVYTKRNHVDQWRLVENADMMIPRSRIATG